MLSIMKKVQSGRVPVFRPVATQSTHATVQRIVPSAIITSIALPGNGARELEALWVVDGDVDGAEAVEIAVPDRDCEVVAAAVVGIKGVVLGKYGQHLYFEAAESEPGRGKPPTPERRNGFRSLKYVGHSHRREGATGRGDRSAGSNHGHRNGRRSR